MAPISIERLATGEKNPDIALHLSFIKDKYASFPMHLKVCFIRKVQGNIGFLKEEKLAAKQKAFEGLLPLLHR